MEPTEAQISEIAEWLDMGMTCYFHRPTGTVEYCPDTHDPFFEAEHWQETLDKIESDRDNYDQFDKMDSRQAFRVMERFAYSLVDEKFSKRLLDALSQRKPFRHFREIVDDSDYRQDWFSFKDQANIEWVKRQMEWYYDDDDDDDDDEEDEEDFD